METHVIDGKVPLLLSQHVQAAMGLVKMMGESKCTVGIGGPEVELCQVKEKTSFQLERAETFFKPMIEADNPNAVLISCGKEFAGANPPLAFPRGQHGS